MTAWWTLNTRKARKIVLSTCVLFILAAVVVYSQQQVNVVSPTGLALDSSLSTIDTDLKANITLHAGTAVIGHVVVDTAPTTAVTGTFWQATQPVSGTFWQTTQPVSGTFWQTTQPVSATSLPLPSGAAQDSTLTGGTVEANAVPKSTSTYALTPKNIPALTTTTTVKSSAGNVYAWTVYNPNASLCVLDFYNTTTPTLGTTAPIFSVPMPATATANVAAGSVAYANFSTAIAVAAETAEAGGSTCGTGMIVNVFYQ